MDARFLATDASAGPSSEAGVLEDSTDSIEQGGATDATTALVFAPGALCETVAASPAIASLLSLPGPAPLAFAKGLRSLLTTCAGRPAVADDGGPGRSEAGVMRCGASGQQCCWQLAYAIGRLLREVFSSASESIDLSILQRNISRKLQRERRPDYTADGFCCSS